MTQLDAWLKKATWRLAKDSTAQVRAEIVEHYEASRDAAVAGGAAIDAAERQALAALGDAKIANRQYRRVLLTAQEARMLSNGNWETRALCSRRRFKGLVLALPAAVAVASAAIFLIGQTLLARDLFVLAVFTCLLPAAMLLPINTPARGRVFRWVKWAAIASLWFYLSLGMKWPVLWIVSWSWWPMLWIEWTRASIRRKLPVAKWPRNIYL